MLIFLKTQDIVCLLRTRRAARKGTMDAKVLLTDYSRVIRSTVSYYVYGKRKTDEVT